jgi:hypothetical protein
MNDSKQKALDAARYGFRYAHQGFTAFRWQKDCPEGA